MKYSCFFFSYYYFLKRCSYIIIIIVVMITTTVIRFHKMKEVIQFTDLKMSFFSSVSNVRLVQGGGEECSPREII